MRLLTALVVIAACGWTAVQGLGVVRFATALSSDASVAPWTAAPGLAGLALEAELRGLPEGGGMDDLRRREELLVRLLAVKPASSRAWLQLASVRSALELPQEKVDAAFIMSGLTGPAEGALMAERALLGVLLWEKSSPDAQSRATTDLCGLTTFDPLRLRLVMATKSDAVKSALRARLGAQGCAASLIKTVGL